MVKLRFSVSRLGIPVYRMAQPRNEIITDSSAMDSESTGQILTRTSVWKTFLQVGRRVKVNRCSNAGSLKEQLDLDRDRIEPICELTTLKAASDRNSCPCSSAHSPWILGNRPTKFPDDQVFEYFGEFILNLPRRTRQVAGREKRN